MIENKQVLSKFFYIDNLNDKKYQEIYQKAKDINLFKNKISKLIQEDIITHSNMSKFDFIKKYTKGKINNLTGKDKEWAVTEVMTTYKNSFKRVKTNLNFKIQKSVSIKFYKKNTFSNKRGDLKSFELKYKTTRLTKTLSFLSKYGYENIDKYLSDKIKEDNFKNEDIKTFYIQVLDTINKFSLNRLLKLALSKRNRLLKTIIVHDFKSLSFKSQSRIKINIVNDNKNKNSKVNGFISVGGYDNYKRSLHLPVKISNKYHGNKKEFSKIYTIHFNGKKIERIILSRKEIEEIPTDNFNFLGIDINIKHNLFSTSDNFTIDYDRDLMNKYTEFLKKIDNRKSKELSVKRRNKYNRWLLVIQNMIIEKSVELIKKAKSKGFNHLVLEDLDLISKLRSSNKEFNINNGRLIRLLNLSSLKTKIRKIAHKYNINVSYIHPEYTSQGCNYCGNIDSNNRKEQEVFKCTKCNKTLNADYNSSINIKERITLDVLNKKLLEFNGYEWNCKKNLKHSAVKKIIIDFFESGKEGHIIRKTWEPFRFLQV